jgi:hypothetical protein
MEREKIKVESHPEWSRRLLLLIPYSAEALERVRALNLDKHDPGERRVMLSSYERR